MKKYIIFSLLIILVIPSVALASWWNPLSWFNGWSFHKELPAPQVQIETQKTSDIKIDELQKQLDDLKKQQTESDAKTVKKDIEKVAVPIVTKETDPEKLWKLWEDYNFPIADGKGWLSLSLTQPSLKETRYYRKEGNQWVRKNSEVEASQPYKLETTPTVDLYAKYRDPVTGEILSPKEYADMVAKKFINYSQNKTLQNNPDPYGVLYGTGIPYTAEQLNSIDCAYYGRNCPTIHVIIDN